MNSRFPVAGQNGQTLISLMIGLLVSSIAVVGMTTIFREVVQVGAEAADAARRDRDSIAAISAVHILLQQAGYGIVAPEGEDYVVTVQNLVWQEDNSSLALFVDDNNDDGEEEDGENEEPVGLVWRWAPSPLDNLAGDVDTLCAVIAPNANGQNKLWLLRFACGTSADSLNINDLIGADSDGWHTTDLGEIKLVTINDGGACNPFGIDSADGTRRITLTYALSTETSDGTPIVVDSSTCLANFRDDGSGGVGSGGVDENEDEYENDGEA